MHPRCAPAIRGLGGGGAPSGNPEDRAFGVKENPVGGEGGTSVECEIDMAGGLSHVRDVDGKYEKRRCRCGEGGGCV